MKLIVGLGNPEPKYNNTRHNIGFAVLDQIADKAGVTWLDKSKFKASVAETQIAGEKVLLIKPNTYYNLSGEAVRAAIDFYKLSAAADVLVIHDELDLPFGTLRTRLSGSDAGNNGIKSIISHIGPSFARIRIGIASDRAEHQDASDYVLSRFSKEEQSHIEKIAYRVLGFIEDFAHEEREFAHTSVKTLK